MRLCTDIPEPGSRNHVAETWNPEPGTWNPKAGTLHLNPEMRNHGEEFPESSRCAEPKIPNPEHETMEPTPETRNPEPGTREPYITNRARASSLPPSHRMTPLALNLAHNPESRTRRKKTGTRNPRIRDPETRNYEKKK